MTLATTARPSGKASRTDGVQSDLVDTTGPEERIIVKAASYCNHCQQDCWYGTDQRYEIQVPPDPRYPEAERYAVEVRGPNMNLRYPEGSLLICVPLDVIEGRIEIDQPYLIERRRGRSHETGLFVKTLIADSDNRPRFVSESSDPNYQISLPIFGTGGDKIRPIALVTGFLQPE